MRARPLDLRAFLKLFSSASSIQTYSKSSLSSSSSSSQTRLNQPFGQKSFFESDCNDGLVKHLCRQKKFKEAIEILCQQKRLREAIQVLDLLHHSRIRPTTATYSTLLDLCLQQRALEEGKRVHAHTKISGSEPELFIANRLLDLYLKCESLMDAQKLFDDMSERDLCSWNTIISGYVKSGKLEEARKLFKEMPEKDNFSWSTIMSGYVRGDNPQEALELYRRMQKIENSKSNKFTVSSALAASAAVPCLRHGKEIHCHILRTGLDSDEVVWSALSDMYGKCGSIEEARRIFDKMFDRDVVSWTTMIGRYFEGGRREEGFELFIDLLRSGMRANEFTFAGVLNACSDQVAEDLGKLVHGQMVQIGFDPCSFAASALIHMYSKCGNIESAEQVFKELPQPDLVSWTSMIIGYAQNGRPEEAVQYFELLLKSGNKPDHVTFVGVLSACTHAGLVDKGIEYFNSINGKHGLTLTTDHHACLIDLLCRSGRLKEAEEVIDKMPMEPNKILWASLLNGCRIHGNIRLAERAAGALFEIEPENPATYVTLANIYATIGLWDEVAKIREIMDDRGVVKKPGLSWIKVKRQVHVFLVGDKSHPKYEEIHVYLEEISTRMKEEGYIPDTNFVLHDVEEEQKEQNLSYHSEKLAVAFGVIASPPGMQIKVFKNLRTCGDCHTAFKFISKIVKREIIMRDSNRYHHFKDGSCSCRDFW